MIKIDSKIDYSGLINISDEYLLDALRLDIRPELINPLDIDKNDVGSDVTILYLNLDTLKFEYPKSHRIGSIDHLNKILPVLFCYELKEGYKNIEDRFLKEFKNLYYDHTENLIKDEIFYLTFSEVNDSRKLDFITLFMNDHLEPDLKNSLKEKYEGISVK